MDIHRSRFVPYPAAAINTLAFSHSDSKDTGKGAGNVRLAIGRANGNIEVWNPGKDAEWIHEITLSGGKDRSVEGLAWTQEPDEESEGFTSVGRLRLFSIGYSSTVTEWDLVTGLPLRNSSGNHSEIWCLAAQPRWKAGQKAVREGEFRGQNLVVGCADGSLAVLSTDENDLRFSRFLSRPTAKKARVLSVTYQSRDIVVAGFADSAIRIFDSRNGQLLRKITLGAPSVAGPREILVWAVKCLPNGDIVSGDCSGEVRFYDGKNYSLLQRISSHKEDVLALAVSRDGKTVFSGGMDQRTTVYTLSGNGPEKRWLESGHRKFHEHDLKTMATYESKGLSILVSGGLDTHPVLVPIRSFSTEHSRKLSALPQSPPVTSAPRARLLVSWWDREVRIWRVKKRDTSGELPKLVARLALKGDENITSASISEDGSILAISTVAEIKVFHLSLRKGETDRSLRVRKLDSPPLPQEGGARLVQLSPNGRWLAIITHENEIFLARLTNDEDEPSRWRIVPRVVELQRLHRKLEYQNSLNGYWGSYDRIITRVALSNEVLVVSDLAGYLDSWVVEGNEDITAPEVDLPEKDKASKDASSDDDDDDEDEGASRPVIFFGQHWVRNPAGHLLPKLESAALVLSFRPTKDSESQPNGNPAVHPTRHNPHPRSHTLPGGQHQLLAVTAYHQVYEFDVLDGKMTDWSRRNPTSDFPAEFRGQRDRAMGCLWDINDTRQRLWLYGSNWLFMFDLATDFSDGSSGSDGATNGGAESPLKKRKRGPEDALLLRKHSGAGSRKPAREIEGAGRKYRKIIGADAASWVDLQQGQEASDDDDDEADSAEAVQYEGSSALATLRRGVSEGGDQTNDEADESQSALQQQRKSHWHTFKYRPILGLVPISHDGGEGAAAKSGKAKSAAAAAPLEVVLVERPTWDLDLPPKFVGVHER
ncbi:small nucleolar ribonucleoprotein complex [Diplodia corticola]|uniref:Small nucleolar ribonucleoprotein complex n=1 Tax=Diplodia corticola TaxID=236234 RepID=A0A1J9QN48_9PEZI|nr:small nucleolar ribonucleoprotein complex [Diplodia corticola]OJD29490.1 small nucleolar ribonucleoprotein complex [Diplodia corticola]